MSRFAIFTVSILILIGGARVGLDVRGMVLVTLFDEDAQRAKALKTCETFFSDGEGDRPNDRVQSKDAYPPLPSIVPEGQSRCQTWYKQGRLIVDEFSVWHTLLWVVGALLGGATLVVVFLVFRRSSHAGALMMQAFLAQVLAAVGEIYIAGRESSRGEDLLLTLWPELQNQGFGWLLINSDWMGTVGRCVVLCLVYLGLVLMVRSKRMWTF